MVVAAVLISMPIILRRLLPPKWISSAFKPVSRYISRVLSKISGIFRFSIAEILLYLVVASVLFYIVFTVIRIIRKKDPPIYILRCLSRVVLGLCSLVFLFNTLWGFNLLSLASELKMDIGRYSVALRLATESFVVELNAISSEIPRFHNGVSKFESFDELADKAIEGWTNLAKSNAAFSSVRVAKPKRLSSVASELMSRAGITGIYIPFTGEANVNVGHLLTSRSCPMSSPILPVWLQKMRQTSLIPCLPKKPAQSSDIGLLRHSYTATMHFTGGPGRAYELMFSLNREVLRSASLRILEEIFREMHKVATR